LQSFNGELRDGLLHGEDFNTLEEAQLPVEKKRYHYDCIRPHAASGYR
jgi:hypothetical protein